MTTTREQFELAAKAMGIKMLFDPMGAPRNCTGAHPTMNIFACPLWNPATDQADNDRMACKLRIDTYLSGSDGDNFYVVASSYNRVVGREIDFIIERRVNHNNTDEDVCRAVREARLAVAVEIGRAMK